MINWRDIYDRDRISEMGQLDDAQKGAAAEAILTIFSIYADNQVKINHALAQHYRTQEEILRKVANDIRLFQAKLINGDLNGIDYNTESEQDKTLYQILDVQKQSYFLYQFSIFESLIHNMTEFLFYICPEEAKSSKDTQIITLKDLVENKNRSDIISTVISSSVRSLNAKPIDDRIIDICKRFFKSEEISKKIISLDRKGILKKASMLRNIYIHNNFNMRLEITEENLLVTKKDVNTLTENDIRLIITDFQRESGLLAVTLFRRVCDRVIHYRIDKKLEANLSELEKTSHNIVFNVK
jgi:hypothetical protein